MSRLVTIAGQQIGELAARTADGGRLSRGRALFRKGAVNDLVVVEGSVEATVRGSKGDAYSSSVSTSLAPPGVQREVAEAEARTVNELVDAGVGVCPRDIDLVFDCSCADWEEPCKHVLAVLLAFADRVDLDANELLAWRGIGKPLPTTARPKAVEEKPVDRKEQLSELEALLGESTRRATTAAGEVVSAPVAAPMAPELAEFLGLDLPIAELATGVIAPAAPLFTQRQVGPLADLGPELRHALEIIAELLRDDS